jgi:hypothetical protein
MRRCTSWGSRSLPAWLASRAAHFLKSGPSDMIRSSKNEPTSLELRAGRYVHCACSKARDRRHVRRVRPFTVGVSSSSIEVAERSLSGVGRVKKRVARLLDPRGHFYETTNSLNIRVTLTQRRSSECLSSNSGCKSFRAKPGICLGTSSAPRSVVRANIAQIPEQLGLI